MNEIPLIYSKMAKILKEIGAVSKSQTNNQGSFSYSFRGIDQFQNSLHPLLATHEVFMAPRATKYETVIKEVVKKNGDRGFNKHVSILMEYDFYAVDGSKVTIGPIPAEGLDPGDKATNKALSAALKYCLIQALCVPTQDQVDGDREGPEIEEEWAQHPLSVTTPKTIPTPISVYESEDPRSGLGYPTSADPKPVTSGKTPATPSIQSSTNSYSKNVGTNADYTVDFGKYKGQRIGDIGPQALGGYLRYLKGDGSKDMTKGAADLYKIGTAYLTSLSGN